MVGHEWDEYDCVFIYIFIVLTSRGNVEGRDANCTTHFSFDLGDTFEVEACWQTLVAMFAFFICISDEVHHTKMQRQGP